MLKFMDELNEILEQCFMQDDSFHDAKNTAIRRLINDQQLCPSYFAMYIDTSMQWKGDLMGKSEDEAMILLDKLITIVKFCTAMDVFLKSFEKDFAIRILNNKSTN